MKALLWHGRRAAGWLGRLGCAACLLLALSAALEWGLTAPAQARLRAAQAQHALAQAQLAQVQRSAAGRGGERAHLARLLDPFPPSGNQAIDAAAAAIEEAAMAHHLVLDSSTYQWSVDGSGALERYVISLPLKGRYPELRAFLAQVRQQAPHLALDNVTLTRPAREDPAVEAQLQLTAYFRVGP